MVFFLNTWNATGKRTPNSIQKPIQFAHNWIDNKMHWKLNAIWLVVCWKRGWFFVLFRRHHTVPFTGRLISCWLFFFFSHLFYNWICWLMIISKWHSMKIHRAFCTHRTLPIQWFNSIESDIIYWYQSDDVIVRSSNKSVITNVDNMYPVDIEHARNPFDDILMLCPFRSSRIKSKSTPKPNREREKNKQIIHIKIPNSFGACE